jgi:hypothetical protein
MRSAVVSTASFSLITTEELAAVLCETPMAAGDLCIVFALAKQAKYIDLSCG